MKLGNESKQAIESLALDKGVAVESMYEALKENPKLKFKDCIS